MLPCISHRLFHHPQKPVNLSGLWHRQTKQQVNGLCSPKYFAYVQGQVCRVAVPSLVHPLKPFRTPNLAPIFWFRNSQFCSFRSSSLTPVSLTSHRKFLHPSSISEYHSHFSPCSVPYLLPSPVMGPTFTVSFPFISISLIQSLFPSNSSSYLKEHIYYQICLLIPSSSLCQSPSPPVLISPLVFHTTIRYWVSVHFPVSDFV